MNRMTTPTAAKESAHTAARPPARTDDFTLLQRFCVKCDYDLRGLPEPCMCPECGGGGHALRAGEASHEHTAGDARSGRHWTVHVWARGSEFGGGFNAAIGNDLRGGGRRSFSFLASPRGARFVNRANRVAFIQWDDAEVMSISRWGRATWRLSLRMRFQTLKITAGEVTVHLRGTPRQIARVRAEILRRVNAARRESKVAESRVASMRGTR